MMDTSVSFIGLILIIGSIDILKAEVTFIGGNIKKLNTEDLSYSIIIGFDEGDIDNIEMEWEPPTSPQFDHYFVVDITLDDSETFYTAHIEWNGDRGDDERKLRNRQFVTNAMLGNTIVKQLTRTMKFEWPPTSANINTSMRTPKRGEKLQMTCSSPDKGEPTGTVVWTKDTDVMTGYTDEVLTIDSTTYSDNGLWKCAFTNTRGNSTYSPSLNITVIWPASNVVLTLNDTGPYNKTDSLVMVCRSSETGNPTPTLYFKMNNTVLKDLEQINSSTYRLNSIADNHNGLLKCCYNNTAGEVCSATQNLVVHTRPGKAQITTLSPTTLLKGETLSLRCSLEADKGFPEAFSVTWTLNDNIEHSYRNDSLKIRNITEEQIGEWACYYSNSGGYGPKSDVVNVSLGSVVLYRDVSMDAIITFDHPTKYIMVGDDITFECNVSDKGIPQAEVIWTHNDTVKSRENNYTITIINIQFSDSGEWGCYASNSFSRSNIAAYTLEVKPSQEMSLWMYIVIGVCCGILLIVIIVIIICCVKKKKRKDKKSDTAGHVNRSLQPDNLTGTGPANKPNVEGPANKPNVEAAAPVYAAVSRGKVLAPIAAGADGSVYSQVDLSKKTARQSLKGLPMSKKAIDRIIFHKKDGYVNMTFQVRKKFIGDIEIGVCRIGDQSCTSKVSKQHDGASKDVVMVLPIEDRSPDSYSIRIKFTERGQVTQTVDLTYPYNKNAVNVTVLNDVYGTNVSPSYADVEVEGVPSRPPRQGYPAEGVTYAVMDWDRSQAPGRPPRLSARSQAQEHVVYADVRPGGNVY